MAVVSLYIGFLDGAGVGSRIMGFTAEHEKLWWVFRYWLDRSESVMFQKEKANWKKGLNV